MSGQEHARKKKTFCEICCYSSGIGTLLNNIMEKLRGIRNIFDNEMDIMMQFELNYVPAAFALIT